MKNSCVYVITDGEYVKIGVARNGVENRVNGLQTGNPRKLFVVRTFECKKSEVFLLEKGLHGRFKNYNVKNEWFTLGVLDEIKKYSSEEIQRIIDEQKKVPIKEHNKSTWDESKRFSTSLMREKFKFIIHDVATRYLGTDDYFIVKSFVCSCIFGYFKGSVSDKIISDTFDSVYEELQSSKDPLFYVKLSKE